MVTQLRRNPLRGGGTEEESQGKQSSRGRLNTREEEQHREAEHQRRRLWKMLKVGKVLLLLPLSFIHRTTERVQPHLFC